MSYQAPTWYLLHEAQVVGAAEIFTTSGTFDSSYPVRNVIDDRSDTFIRYTAASFNHSLCIDRGAAYASKTALDLLWWSNPAGLLSPYGAVTIEEADDAAFTTNKTTLGFDITGGASLPNQKAHFIRHTASARRYLRALFFPNSAWDVYDFFWSAGLETTRGPRWDWTDEPLDQADHLPQAAGGFTHRARPDGRSVRLVYDRVQSASDLAIFAQLESHGRTRPVVLLPPDQDEFDENPMMGFLDAVSWQNDHPRGHAVQSRRYTIDFRERTPV